MSEQAMTTASGSGPVLMPVTINELDPAILESLVVNGDCAKLTNLQRVAYYRSRCETAGLDCRTSPLQFINLNGKLVLYALKAATDQLAAKHGIVCEIVDQRTESGVRTVTVRSRTKDGRQTDEIGSVAVGNKQGDDLCNAYMKAVTKAKRRAVLSLCGLGMLDETEIETIKGAAPVSLTETSKPALPAPVIGPGPVRDAEPPQVEYVQLREPETAAQKQAKAKMKEATKEMETAFNKPSVPYVGFATWPLSYPFWFSAVKNVTDGNKVSVGLSPRAPSKENLGNKDGVIFADCWCDVNGQGGHIKKLREAQKNKAAMHILLSARKGDGKWEGKTFYTIEECEHPAAKQETPKQQELIDPPVDHEGPQEPPPIDEDSVPF